MATRSNIAYRTPEGTIRSVYCHWDGYPAHNGEMLRRHYKDQSKIEALVQLGSLSSLNERIAPKGKHNFDKAEDGVVVAYARDRGEQLVISEYADIPSWIDDMEEYAYLWNGREWLVNDHGERDEAGLPIFSRVVDIINPRLLKEIGWDGVDTDPAWQEEQSVA